MERAADNHGETFKADAYRHAQPSTLSFMLSRGGRGRESEGGVRNPRKEKAVLFLFFILYAREGREGMDGDTLTQQKKLGGRPSIERQRVELLLTVIPGIRSIDLRVGFRCRLSICRVGQM